MQYSADFVALGMHQADVRHAERELGLRRSAEERGADDAGASSVARAHRRPWGQHRAPRLALLR